MGPVVEWPSVDQPHSSFALVIKGDATVLWLAFHKIISTYSTPDMTWKKSGLISFQAVLLCVFFLLQFVTHRHPPPIQSKDRLKRFLTFTPHQRHP